jgi:hypothetical protein
VHDSVYLRIRKVFDKIGSVTPCTLSSKRLETKRSILNSALISLRVEWFFVATAWCVFRLRMENIWRVAVNMLNGQLLAAEKGMSSSSETGWGNKNTSSKKKSLNTLHNVTRGFGVLLWTSHRDFECNGRRETAKPNERPFAD